MWWKRKKKKKFQSMYFFFSAVVGCPQEKLGILGANRILRRTMRLQKG
uniref:Uncharacterized protein n=1 Tax=Candidozyma auris TaxID=498019 RepID=A0A0L0NYY7_CANAR